MRHLCPRFSKDKNYHLKYRYQEGQHEGLREGRLQKRTKPDPELLIRVRILQNHTDPGGSGSGSATLTVPQSRQIEICTLIKKKQKNKTLIDSL